MPKRDRSKREAVGGHNSKAQQAGKQITGQSDDRRAQSMTASTVVRTILRWMSSSSHWSRSGMICWLCLLELFDTLTFMPVQFERRVDRFFVEVYFHSRAFFFQA